MTAAAYIAKYVTKNIDWDRLEKDFEGNDSLETSACVEAWASRWRIRQFQQIDGSPVTARATPCGSCTGRRAGKPTTQSIASGHSRDEKTPPWSGITT